MVDACSGCVIKPERAQPMPTASGGNHGAGQAAGVAEGTDKIADLLFVDRNPLTVRRLRLLALHNL